MSIHSSGYAFARVAPRTVAFLLALAVGATGGCRSDSDPTGPSNGPGEEPAPEALRTLHIRGPVGTFAYFQLLWPHVEVALADDPDFATLEPSSAGFLIPGDADGNKEWFASSKAPWIGAQGTPYPGMEITAFLSGTNKTHTQTGGAIDFYASGNGFLSGLAAGQAAVLSAPLPVVVAGVQPIFGVAPDAPTPEVVADSDGLIGLYLSAEETDLTPTAAERALLGVEDAPAPWLAEFGLRMIVAAKALRLGLSNTIVISLPALDPHSAFNDVPATTAIAASLQTVLNGFYELLAADGDTVKGSPSADHVMITVQGDTPKNPLLRGGWPDGTPGGSNWIYVVGKGLLKHGWFGRVHADGDVSGYDPTTGEDDPTRTSASTQGETAAAIAYAVTLRDADYVENVLGGGALSEYEGVVVQP